MILCLSENERASGWLYQAMPTIQLTTKRRGVVYEATLSLIREHASSLAGLVIPSEIESVDYDFEYLIEHVRSEPDERVGRVPIIVSVATDDDYDVLCESFNEVWFRQLAVVATVSPNDSDFETDISQSAYETYLSVAGSEPRFRSGRHDKANAWGAFVLAGVLRSVDKPSVDERHMGTLEERLKEDVYYKRRIIKLQQSEKDKALVTQLVSTRSKLKKCLEVLGSILIVEDQLDEGWRYAYESLFSVNGRSPRLVFAEDIETAKRSVEVAPDLIVLDVRLSTDREAYCQEEADADVSGLSGVKLASWFHQNVPNVPILAATASNKSWTLEALLQHGVNNYWVKGAPEAAVTWNQCVANVLDLHKKLAAVIQWSVRTRSWIDDLYRIADIVDGDDRVNGERLRDKAKSLHALLFSAFGPFRDEMSHGLQMNLAFLIAFSAINDLVDWLCEVEVDDEKGVVSWFIHNGEDRELILVKNPLGELQYQIFFRGKANYRKDFPDVEVATEVLNQLRLYDSTRVFRKMKEIRNGLPLTHGKATQDGNSSKSVDRVKDQDISDLLGVLRALSTVRQKESPR